MQGIRYLKRKIANIFRRYKILYSDDFQNFVNAKTYSKIVLIDTPTHGNLGDQAIVLAEKKFLAENLSLDTYEFTQQEYLLCENEIITAMNQNDTILVHGGGFIGTLWQNEEDVLLRILEKLGSYKIVVLPQTVFFGDSEAGRKEKNKFIETQKMCRNLTILARDRKSYEYLKEMGICAERCAYVPDSVTYLNYKKIFKRNDLVLLCLRRDKEKSIPTDSAQEIINILSVAGLDHSYTDTVTPYRISREEREKEVTKKLDEFAQCKFVITDRLHGMLFSAITGTPCLFMDNCSHKVSGTYEWIKNLEYIKPLKDMDSLRDFICQLNDQKTYHYDNTHLQPYYEKLAEIIRGGDKKGAEDSGCRIR